MKKIFILCILSLVLALSATTQQGKTIEDENGFDWANWSDDMHGFYIKGFLSAQSEVIAMTYELNQNLPRAQFDNLMRQTNDQFFYQGTVGGIVQKMNDYYAVYANRKFSIYRTIAFVCGKNWWNSRTGKVDVPSSPQPNN